MRGIFVAEGASPDMMPVLRHGPAVAHILDTAMAVSGRRVNQFPGSLFFLKMFQNNRIRILQQ